MQRFLTKRPGSTAPADAFVANKKVSPGAPQTASSSTPMSTPCNAKVQLPVKAEVNTSGHERNAHLEKIRSLALDQGVVAQVERFAVAYPAATEDMVKIIVNIAKGGRPKTSGASASLQTPSTSMKMERAPSAHASAAPAPASGQGFPSADEAGVVLPQVMCLYPRGKHNVEVHKSGVFFRAKNVAKSVFVDFSELESFFVLPMADKYQKQLVTTHVLRFKNPVKVGKQESRHLVMSFKTKATKPVVAQVQFNLARLPKVEKAASLGPSMETVMEDISEALFRFLVPKSQVFSSSKDVFASEQGDNCVKCYLRVSEGFVFPLSCGIFFLNKPFLFLPANDMVGLEQGRAGSGRTMDFIVTMEDDTVHEFSMIRSEEKTALSCYMQYISKKICRKREIDNKNEEDSSATEDEGAGEQDEAVGEDDSGNESEFDLEAAEDAQSSSGEEDSDEDDSASGEDVDDDGEELVRVISGSDDADSATDDEEVDKRPAKRARTLEEGEGRLDV